MYLCNFFKKVTKLGYFLNLSEFYTEILLKNYGTQIVFLQLMNIFYFIF